MKGILNINKPTGLTSSDVVVKVRKILKTRAVGHMGTLDPQGEGVLLIGVGKATRLFDHYLKKDKVYEAEFTFGVETTTLDGEGEITAKTENIPSKEQIESALNGLIGNLDQMPPKYSAKSVGGVRAYDLARKGIEFELKTSKITVFNFELIKQVSSNVFVFKIHCSAGTYIRSLARDLAYSLNSLAIMTAIKRTRCGAFCVEDAVSLEKLSELSESALVSVEEATKDLPRVDFADEQYEKILNGIKIPFESENESVAVYCKNELFGLGQSKEGILKITTFLKD